MSEFNESLYFRDLNRYPTLSQQEEEALLTIIVYDLTIPPSEVRRCRVLSLPSIFTQQGGNGRVSGAAGHGVAHGDVAFQSRIICKERF